MQVGDVLDRGDQELQIFYFLERLQQEAEMAGGKRSKWMAHVRKTMKSHKGKSLKQVLKLAAKSYKGGSYLSPSPVGGETGSLLKGGRRRSRRGTKKGSRKH